MSTDAPKDRVRSANLAMIERWLPHSLSIIAITLSVWALVQNRSDLGQSRAERVTELLDEGFDLLSSDPHLQQGAHNRVTDPKILTSVSRKIDRALLLEPGSERAYQLKAFYHATRAQYALAEQSARKAIDIAPRSAFAYYTLGNVYHAALDLPKAESAYRFALAMDPQSSEALEAFGTLFLFHGHPAKAIPLLQRAAALPHADSETFLYLAFALGRAGRLDEANAAASQAVEHNPGDPLALETLAYTLAGIHRPEDAIRVFNKVAQVNSARAKSATEAAHLLATRSDLQVKFVAHPEDSLDLLLGPESEN